MQDIDSPDASIEHSRLIRSKGFLHRIYSDHYRFFERELSSSAAAGDTIELGSGGGFIKEIIPGTITSDVVVLPSIDLAFSAQALPFSDQSLRGIMMINVLHHIQNVRDFFREAERTLTPGGKLLMVEPSATPFARFIYSNFHHEPFDTAQSDWALPPGGRLSMANDALPWIVFCRDRAKFEAEFPKLSIRQIQCCMPFSYILSGGVSRPQMVPSWSYSAVSGIEKALTPFNPYLGLFMRIVVARI